MDIKSDRTKKQSSSKVKESKVDRPIKWSKNKHSFSVSGTVFYVDERYEYIKEIKGVLNTPEIKVVTGIRRAGKSKLMEEIIKYVKTNDTNANIIHINFNNIASELNLLPESLVFIDDNP